MAHVALKLLPSAVVAVMTALPGAMAVTKPVEVTVAMLLSLEDQITD